MRADWPLSIRSDVFTGRFDVLAADDAVKRVRVRAEPGVRLQLPVLQIVQRFESGPRKVGNFVAMNPDAGQAFHRSLIKLGRKLVARDVGRAVAFPVEQDLAAQAGCLRRFRAYRPRRAEAQGARSTTNDSAHDARVCPGRPAIKSILILARPAERSIAISRSTISAVCLRPVRANSRCTNDCTPRLTRLIPARTHAAARSSLMPPGAASSVASFHPPPLPRVRAATVRERF